MSSAEKLINKFLSRKNITVEDCDRLLIYYGYEYHKTGGSHRVYHQKNVKSITIVIPKKSKYIASLYINQLIKDLGLEGQDGKK
ncbi:MAG: type II toxin-antitoxin system HicA family toxin [Dehalococcoidales bacterium]